MCNRYVATLVIDDEVVSTHLSKHTMAKTLRCAADLLKGVPQAEVCIRRRGDMAAWLHTNWRGDLDEVLIHGNRRGRGWIMVTPMNPRYFEVSRG